MNEIKLQPGADAQKIADLIGGVLIAINGDIALIAGGDITKLNN